MSEQTYHATRQDLRKAESRVANLHGGQNPADSNLSHMKSIIDQNSNKPEQIERVKANLPLPEQPPTASDWSSSDQRTVNVGSGGIEGPISSEMDSGLRGPATASSSVRVSGSELHQNTAPSKGIGRQAVEGLDDLPSDAKAR
ncbi:hypothetical protein NUU61_006356 [Penicillium alfredii]|uniref:Uncharacterized protein n=1 Tax=Penicillium alfredii TaxID=1506179 RepID=A0A9W9K3N7_9EURO|nr:uncharacterized protein NUU61_006356 [Penicillium alfredii]KAJ5091486.1 hypothetical protein NUU61_006356 [Penicillium alfredii]